MNALDEFRGAEAGQSLRHYVLAVAAAALAVIVVFTLLAERIYLAVLELFGPG